MGDSLYAVDDPGVFFFSDQQVFHVADAADEGMSNHWTNPTWASWVVLTFGR